MSQWTEQGEKLVNDIAQRYGTSYEAVSLMLESILRGNGTMAQFNIYELGGGGQWMRGGMTMVGDMFNYQLKSKVDGICGDLSNAILDQNIQVVPPPPPLKPGSGHPGQSAPQWGQWWPSELGVPNTSGSQNQYRYAYFAGLRRLAISDGQNITVYDTLDHSIGGVSQQQGGVAGVGFTSQYGNVDLRSLPLISGINVGVSIPSTVSNQDQIHVVAPVPPIMAGPDASKQPMTHTQVDAIKNPNEDVFSTIERLAKLRDSGAITEEEFASKKTELLARI